MSSPLANMYQLVDPPGQGTNPLTVNSQGAGSTGQPLLKFVAASVANAMQVAYIISSALQRPLLLVSMAAPTPYTLVVGIGPGTGLTQVPSGITY